MAVSENGVKKDKRRGTIWKSKHHKMRNMERKKGEALKRHKGRNGEIIKETEGVKKRKD